MTNKEQSTVDALLKALSDMREENRMFRNDVSKLVETINTKTEKKHLPVTLEQDILHTAQKAVGEAIKTCLTGYSSPMSKLVTSVIDENSTFLRQVISDSFNTVIRTEDFKRSIVNAFSHKVSRSIISNNDGLFDKVANELKQDSVFKAKMALAVSNVVNECLNNRIESV